jgi:galactokinase
VSGRRRVFDRPAPRPHWSNYIRGAVTYAQWSLGGVIRRGFEFLIDSTIPPGGGSSSSSAIVVLAGAAIREVNGIGYGPAELARASSQAEWYLGTRGGALDHTAICLGRRHHALVMDHSVQVSEALQIPGDPWRWVTFFSQAADKGRAVMLEVQRASRRFAAADTGSTSGGGHDRRADRGITRVLYAGRLCGPIS